MKACSNFGRSLAIPRPRACGAGFGSTRTSQYWRRARGDQRSRGARHAARARARRPAASNASSAEPNTPPPTISASRAATAGNPEPLSGRIASAMTSVATAMMAISRALGPTAGLRDAIVKLTRIRPRD